MGIANYILIVLLMLTSLLSHAQINTEHTIEIVIVESLGANIESKHKASPFNPYVFESLERIEVEDALNFGVNASDSWMLYLDYDPVDLNSSAPQPLFAFRTKTENGFKSLNQNVDLVGSGKDWVGEDGYKIELDYQVQMEIATSSELSLTYTLTAQ